jgi:hypothetical protein
MRRGDERFTKGGAKSAVHDGNRPAIGQARFKHPASIGRGHHRVAARAAPQRNLEAAKKNGVATDSDFT